MNNEYGEPLPVLPRNSRSYCHVHFEECEGPYETRRSILGAKQTLCAGLWATADKSLWPEIIT